MENMKSKASPDTFSMNGGKGPYSYANNSSYQKAITDHAKKMIDKAIADNLDIIHFPSSNPFRIADLGCSVGPNTFFSVQNILEAVEHKYQTQGLNSKIPEFQVYFNDQTGNDFNTLFSSLPSDRGYFVAGVPGSFHVRLFPEASLHVVHSSCSLHWLSKVPKEVVIGNEGNILYTSAPMDAYSAQFAEDMDTFLNARAKEIAPQGLLVLVIVTFSNGIPPSLTSNGLLCDLLASTLMDMAKMGLVSEAKVRSFKLPVYYTSPQEFEGLVEKNGCFSMEKMETLSRDPRPGGMPNFQMCSLHVRAAMEELIKENLGSDEMVDEFFNHYTDKLVVESSSIFKPGYRENVKELFVLLKRKN